MNRLLRNVNAFLAGVLLVAVLTYCSQAYAGGPDIEQETNVVLTGGDNTANNAASVSGSRSYGLGMGSGAIDDCMAHLSVAIVNIPLRNKFCQNSEFANWAENGRHTPASIKIRCSTKTAKEVFGSKDECAEVFALRPAVDYEEDVNVDELISEIASLQARLTLYESRLKTIDRKATKDAESAKRSARAAQASANRVEQAEQADREYAIASLKALEEYRK